ncbi:uncharacterized protein ACLA_019520 [Aspergillus clavatus NRRL 1]|uniref:Uncharacterized protein n=1 Tax=Aspergillus clavatus (strain ATCC 1007 / CBS 513.65 / DSM 816 / NCTC 3887 / NRRL 1 / QM 1276 / 107) TaxID=344612 RepID=A1CNM6_ASPCL|nr:uncharacterized protein ACLA_019520 [Aspergillus clavatus NRRL 1]EAW07247.1 conserved hypothetical protein [Aspergillus clavatus NRRL 1]
MSSEKHMPSSDGTRASIQSLPLWAAANSTPSSLQVSDPSTANGDGEVDHQPHQPEQDAKALVHRGDVILQYTSTESSRSNPPRTVIHRWQVSSEDLVKNSPYFRALLDPNKFSEGRHFMQQRTIWSQRQAPEIEQDEHGQLPGSNGNALHITQPTIRLPDDQFLSNPGADAIELFLKILSYNSFADDTKHQFDAELRSQPTSLVARLVETGDALNSPHAVRDALRRSTYVYGKGKISLSKFDTALLKLSEDRIRQSIIIARFLDDQHVFHVMTHALIVIGSRHWVNGIENHSPGPLQWTYLPDGLEEELFYRRQCVLNTIADLQAYFLRAYGALEETPDHEPKANAPTLPGFTSTLQPRQFQCRCGYGNSNACDAFHLGQMIRFFTLRTKTIFLGSSLLDPDFSPEALDDTEHSREPPGFPAPGPPADITAVISALKQCPDYQLDANHIGCGVRRRFVPPLDCIERFVGDGRGLLGVELRSWDARSWRLASGSWANRSRARAAVVEIRVSKIVAVRATPSGLLRASSQEENARFFFTARKRNWEA